LAGAVPIDLLQEEQNRISTELADAEARMANAEVHWEYLEKNLDRALAFAAFHDGGFRGWIIEGARTNLGPLVDRGSNVDIEWS
jgi:hypothetical protein